VEGPTDDLHVEKLRNRQVKNFFAATLLSIGTPMILMGDEVRRTQHGNNNAYCHDGELNWFECRARASTPDPRPVDPAGQQVVAWRESGTAGLESRFPLYGVERGTETGAAANAPDHERVLGATGR
jgi:hypothetical protein